MKFKDFALKVIGATAAMLAIALTAGIAPAQASVAAATDPTQKFSVTKNLTLSGNTATGTVYNANSGRGYYSASYTIDKVVADTLIGHQLSGSVVITGPNGVIDPASAGFTAQYIIYANGSSPVGQSSLAAGTPTVTWPAVTNAATTLFKLTAYLNSTPFSWPVGAYSFAYTMTVDGVPVTLGNGIALTGATMDYYVVGTNTLGYTEPSSTISWDSGTVCVDMAQVASGNVLTVQTENNGTVSSSTVSPSWYTGGGTTSVSTTNPHTITSAEFATGAIAVRRSAIVTGTTGQPLTAALFVRKADNTDVSIPCAVSSAPAAPTVTVSLNTVTQTLTGSLPAGYGTSCVAYDSANRVVARNSSTTNSCFFNMQVPGTHSYTVGIAYTNSGVPGTYTFTNTPVTVMYAPPALSCGVPITSMTASVSALGPSDSYFVYYNNNPALTNCWTPMTGYSSRVTINGNLLSTPTLTAGPVNVSASSYPKTLADVQSQYASWFSSNPMTNGDVLTFKYYSGLTAAATASDVPTLSYSVVLNPSPVVSVSNVMPTAPTAPLVRPISAPRAGVVSGSKIVVQGSNLTSLASVTIAGQPVTVVKTEGGFTFEVPTGLASGKYDILITTKDGSTRFEGAIKVSDSSVEVAAAKLAQAAASIRYRAPIDLTVGKTVSASQAAAAKTFAHQYRDAKSAVCIAIPATKATASAALAAATKVCDSFKAQIPGIKTTVVLGAPSGDKVNRVSAEVQG